MRTVGATAPACTGGCGGVCIGGGDCTCGGGGACTGEGAFTVAANGNPFCGTGGRETGGGPGVGGGMAMGAITGLERGGVDAAPTSTDRLTTTVGVGFSLGEEEGTAGTAGAFGGASFVVDALASLLSGTRFEKVLIEDF
jgi:hypothetical protein